MPIAMEAAELFKGNTSVRARALCLGERIDLRSLETVELLGRAPLAIRAGGGCAVLFRYGAVVLFGLDPVEEVAFLRLVEPLVGERFPEAETEEAEIRIDPDGEEQATGGIVTLRDASLARLQTVADALAKSVVLGQYERIIAQAFDRIEPLALALERGKSWRKGRELTAHIGRILLIHQKMVGRVEVAEKPELLWERSDLERLYVRLADEYELRERHLALDRKLDLIARTAETLLELTQNQHTLRVEWYIVILIVMEILLTLYELFFRH